MPQINSQLLYCLRTFINRPDYRYHRLFRCAQIPSATRPVPLLTESQTALETHLTILPNIAKSNTSTYSFTLCDTAAFTTAKSKSITFPRNNATATKHSNIAKLSILRHLHVSSSCIIRGGFLVSMLHCRESHITSLWYL